MKYHHTPIGKAKIILKQVKPSADKDAEPLEPSSIADENAKWYSDFGKQFGTFL